MYSHLKYLIIVFILGIGIIVFYTVFRFPLSSSITTTSVESVSRDALKSEYDAQYVTKLQTSDKITDACKADILKSAGIKGDGLSAASRAAAIQAIQSLTFEVDSDAAYENGQALVEAYQGKSIYTKGLSYVLVITAANGKISKIAEQTLSVSHSWGE